MSTDTTDDTTPRTVVRIDTSDPYALPEVEEGEPVGFGDRLRDALASGNDSNPLYPRLLRLRHVHPNGWQRALLVEGMAILGALGALADRASAWAIVVLPVAAAGVVKFHDVLSGFLPQRARPEPPAGGDA
ncbi:MAG TPA: hypothetical protein VFQ85_01830 [Mycobacteriales bacterium]|jgi:hypothetical protein|nr:hypothetical protein [Mycobacteriales bacterium]